MADRLRCADCGVPSLHAPRLGLCHPCYDSRRGTTTYRQQRDGHEDYLDSLPVVRADGLLHSGYYRAWLASRRPDLPSRVYLVATDLPVRTGRVVAVEEVEPCQS